MEFQNSSLFCSFSVSEMSLTIKVSVWLHKCSIRSPILFSKQKFTFQEQLRRVHRARKEQMKGKPIGIDHLIRLLMLHCRSSSEKKKKRKPHIPNYSEKCEPVYTFRPRCVGSDGISFQRKEKRSDSFTFYHSSKIQTSFERKRREKGFCVRTLYSYKLWWAGVFIASYPWGSV